MKALYLPGLDGEARWVNSTQAHLHEVELVPFAYPSGRDLNWDELSGLVITRMISLGTGLLIGESFGGAVAQKTTIAHREHVHGLCLISAFSHEPAPFAAAIGRAATKMLPKLLLNPVARMLAGWKLAGTLEGEERQKFLAYFEKLDHTELARRLKLLAGFDVSDHLQSIRCPVDILYGSRDSISAAPAQLKLWQRLPNVRVQTFAGFGHMIAQEVPAEVAEGIRSWIERVGATSAR